MATRRELPPDFAAALDLVPEARDRFAAMPADRQAQWLGGSYVAIFGERFSG